MAAAIIGIIIRDRFVVAIVVVADEVVAKRDQAALTEAAPEVRMLVVNLRGQPPSIILVSEARCPLTPESMTAILTPLPVMPLACSRSTWVMTCGPLPSVLLAQ